VNVTVVDRGPYVAGREYDLTEATARAIWFLAVGVGPIWVGVG
jgi:rare lipoprotein A (peptidoglycan hydrolase)